LGYLYFKDKHEPEPIVWVAIAFACGAILVLPVAQIEKLLVNIMGLQVVNTSAQMAKVSWILGGIVEESAKLVMVLLLMFRQKEFDEPIDGIIYAGAVALGFASAENVIYINSLGASVILVRGPISTLGHMLFSSIWGYALGKAKFDPKNRMTLLLKGFALSAFFHGLFNFLIFTKVMSAILVYILMMVLWRMLAGMVAEAEANSPFAPKNRKVELK